MSHPRVAFFADSFHEVNGVALTSREFTRFAADSGRPFLSVHAGPRTAHFVDGDFETFEMASSGLILRLERDLSFDLAFLRHRARLRQILRAFKPDLIHVTGPSHTGMLGVLAAHEMNIPLAASWHTNLHEFAERRALLKMGWMPEGLRQSSGDFILNSTLNLTLRFYQMARLLFAPNPELVEMLQTRARRPAYLMQRGIDTDLYSPSRRKRSDEAFVIGFVGRLSPEKNVRLLKDIESHLRAQGLQNYRFLIVGDGSERAWLKANLQQAEVPGVLSGVPLAEAYASMDAFVFPSQTDTFGNVILEALASGVPAIVSGQGGPKFLVRPGETGFVAPNALGFAQPVLDMARNPEAHARMRTAARQAAMERSWARVFERVYAHYQEILPQRGYAPSLRPHAPVIPVP